MSYHLNRGQQIWIAFRNVIRILDLVRVGDKIPIICSSRNCDGFAVGTLSIYRAQKTGPCKECANEDI
jgi:hypothetical protein